MNWPATPPRLIPRIAERPKCSSAYLFIWDAMDLVGRAKFGGDWTGSELDVLDWPVSPDAEREQQVAQAKKLAARANLRPASKVALRAPPATSPVMSDFQADFSSHVWARRAFLYRSSQQAAWEANRSALGRLHSCAEWLHARFGEGEVRTYTRMVGTPGEPVELQPSDWYCENAFQTRFVPGRYERLLPRMSRPTPVYIFVERESFERAISTLAHAEAIVVATDLAKCSAPLRFAVVFSLKHSVELAGYWKRLSLEAAIKEEWNKAYPSEPMLPAATTRMGYVIYPPDADATAQGQKGGSARKRV